jgi:ATP-binding cassette subfamily F protein 3
MLNLAHLNFLAGSRPLFQDATLQIFAEQRVGLVGKNGCGKSTLFRLIRGELKPDGGEIALQAGKTLAFVEQEISNSDKPALEFVLDGDSELRELERQLARSEHDAAWFEAQQRFEAIEGYAAPARAAQLLAGLGFAPDQLQRPVASFSGGWRMRLNLACALMKRADLLLLDEPTNHLDLEAILWLEQYLARYPGSLLIVSHDREFLNACVNRIAHISNQAIDLYTGTYDDFERARAERAAQHNEALRQQQDKIAHLEDFVRRFRAKATKARQAQSRLKALERIERIAPAHLEHGHFELEIEAPERGPDTLMRAEKAAVGYGDKTLLKDINLALRAGARIALLGPNGAGKSTLIKLLAGELAPMQGKFEVHPDIHIGYFAQHQLEKLDLSATPLAHMERLAPGTPGQELRNFLGRFGLAGESEDRPAGSFSGGEKSRLALALLAWTKPHLLLLDEPTNHLDLDMRDALTVALEDYAGAMVLVSHDRSLIRATADELWLIADGSAVPFDGDLEDYRAWVETRRAQTTTAAKPAADKPKREAPVRRKALLSKQAKLEGELSTAQARLEQVQAALADPATYANPGDPNIAALNQERTTLEASIASLEESWLELEIALEAAG